MLRDELEDVLCLCVATILAPSGLMTHLYCCNGGLVYDTVMLSKLYL